MPVKIEFSTANAAFADGNGDAEIASILRYIARHCFADGEGFNRPDAGPIRDLNGNTIGQWSATIAAEQEESDDD